MGDRAFTLHSHKSLSLVLGFSRGNLRVQNGTLAPPQPPVIKPPADVSEGLEFRKGLAPKFWLKVLNVAKGRWKLHLEQRAMDVGGTAGTAGDRQGIFFSFLIVSGPYVVSSYELVLASSHHGGLGTV